MYDHRKSGENILENIIETIADAVPKQKSGGFFNEGASVADKLNNKINKHFGRQKSVHHILGGGKSADVFLWRNKKISSSVLVGATLVWVFFEWLDYHFLTLVCFALVIGMVVQFVWANASGIINRSSSEVPRLVLPNEYFVNAAVSIGAQVNMFLGFIQDVACGRDLKMFAMVFDVQVVLGLWAAAVIGSWCNFLTVLYIGFVAVHTVPVLYEKYEDQVDDFIYNLLGQLQLQYRKLDKGVLSKIPKGNLKSKKNE
ncbi:Reticulon-like protein B8 [Dendrobium catenatum]|uniref:Reticulon-like protein n=1 Tax=Dendrobium catenatum TaxID=906689 RepID=A0A2I0VE70_9ASPA|nr:Reticulon-like protein B8 [Dendrobium catenatum]